MVSDRTHQKDSERGYKGLISVQYINLNMTPSGTLPVVYMSQYDVGRPIGLNVYSSGEAVNLSGYTITIEATRTDGTAITTGVSISGNIAFFVTTATMTNKADRYNAQLILVDSNARRVGSIPMIFLVVPASMDEDAESIEEDRSLFQQYTETVMSEIAGIHNADNTMSAQIAQIVSRGGAVDIQHGFVNVSVEATASAEFSVNFGHAFSTTPNVVCTVRHGSEGTQQIVKIKTITTTGFTGSVYNYHTTGTANTQVEWIAVTGLSDVNAEISDAHVSADGTTYGSLGNAIRGQVTDLQEQIEDQATDFQAQIDELEETIEESGVAVNSFRAALLNCFDHVAWIDDNGQTYRNALYDALYNAPTSINAVFVQGGATIYNNDSLDVLRQYLVVTANYEDGTTRTVSDYTLSGTLAVGTSTITAAFGGKTDTFTVTVTQAQSYITAVYTQSGTVYVDEGLDVLKSDLVVTYYANESAQGVVVPASDYTLSGALTAGTSTVMVSYLGNTTTFTVSGVVDWYNTFSWSTAAGNLYMPKGAFDNDSVWALNSYIRTVLTVPGTSSAFLNNFCHSYVTRGLNAYYEEPTKFPIPVPVSATSVTISSVPSTIYMRAILKQRNDDGTYSYISGGSTGWSQGSATLNFTAGSSWYLLILCKTTSATDGGSAITLDSMTVTFS